MSEKPSKSSAQESARPDDAQFVQTPVESLQRVISAEELERVRKAVVAVGEAAYHWVIESDEIFWSANAPEVLHCPASRLVTGRAYADLLDADNFTTRYDAVMRTVYKDEGEGIPYQIEYLFRPDGKNGRTAYWLEDTGRWYAGADGRPAEAFGIVRRVDDRHSRDQQLNFLGNCDPLTGMMNRGRMAEALEEAIVAADREGVSRAFVIAGINNLAVVNDAYGFEVADEVIIAVGRRLKNVVRAGDPIARYSGSKFAVIINNCSEEDLQHAAERFLEVARESVIDTEHGPVWAMLSIGAIILPGHAADANTAMARTEEALTEAKRLPSDGFVIYKPSQKLISERSINARAAHEIVACLKEDRFKLAFQPIVDAASREVVMHEALLRMADERGDMIAAAHLIPIAEKLGLVRLIDRTVAQLTVSTLLAYPEAHLSFNVSGVTATDPRWFGQLTEILKEHSEVTPRLTVEITETVALSELDETVRFTRTLRDLGCRVAIDDFGAGYTSFRNLKALNVDILKLDGSFCANLKENQENQYFVRSLIDMARKFELKTIAEWVETPEDAEFLRTWGADYLQGNLFGKASLDVPWTTDDAVASEQPTRQDEADVETAEESAVLKGPADYPTPEIALARQRPEANEEPDMSRLRMAIDALNAQFRRKRG
ncbi:putative bifunctional diguanylate cyclase/phosphodiesterase [Taklimakanibacter deserti]|uniref:putative bifunctional diguanylate cyclase/phosphodiesterase n=1 Tax=Taklimakanibacter deserti TaxID=2267839 RepID=UPI0013C3F788